MTDRRNAKARKRAVHIVGFAIALIAIVFILFPIVWVVPVAFRNIQEVSTYPLNFFPKEVTLENFEKIFTLDLNGYHFISSMVSTLVVAVSAVALSLLVNTMAAYSFARVEYPAKSVLWSIVIFTMFIPGITILLTSVRVVNLLHLTDTIFVLIIPGLASGYNIFFFRQFFLNLPMSLEEAAEIDGCSKFMIFFKMFLPLSVTPMIIIGSSVFMGNWNSFVWPMLTIINRPEYAQIMQLIRILQDTYAGNFGVVIAATLVSLLPPFVMFAFVQKYMVDGIAISGLK